MEQLGRLDQYQKELAKLNRSKNCLPIGPRRINAAGLLSKLWDGKVIPLRKLGGE